MAENSEQLRNNVNIPSGMSQNSEDAAEALNNAVMQKNLLMGKAPDMPSALGMGFMGGAAGAQAAQGTTNPFAAAIQGVAAGMQVNAAIWKQRRAELQNALDAAPALQTMPDVVNKPGYEIFKGLPTKIVQQAIAAIGQDAIRLKMQAEEQRKTNEEKAMLSGEMKTEAGEPLEYSPTDISEKAPGNLAAQYGLPQERRNPYYKMPPKVYEKVRTANSTLAIKEIGKLQDAASSMDNVVNSLQRAKSLIDSGLETGPITGRIPGRKLGNDAQEFEQIASTILPSMRSGMPGAVSDRDMAIFREANFGLTKDENVNRKVIDQQLAIATRVKDKAEFMANWATVYGDMSGANSEWAKYIRENPLFNVNGTINPNVMTYKQFFDTKSGRVGEWTPEKEAKLQELRAKAGK